MVTDGLDGAGCLLGGFGVMLSRPMRRSMEEGGVASAMFMFIILLF